MVTVRDEATTDRWPEETRNNLRCAGVSMPLSALRSVRGMGVGEFPDLKRLVDVCAGTGLRLIHMAPVSDTTAHPHAPWLDTSPYSPISAHALHPLYLGLSALPDLPQDLAREVQVASERLNARAHMAASASATGSSASPPPHVGGKGHGACGAGSGGAKRGGRGGEASEDVLTTKLALLRRAYETSGKKLVEILKSQQNVPLQSNGT